MRTAYRALLRRIAAADSRALLAREAAAGFAADGVVLARLWVLTEGQRLRLSGSAGNPAGGGSYTRLDGEFATIPVGHGKIGAIAADRRPHIVRGIRGDELWLSNPAWAARQGVRAFLGYPLLAQDTLTGVLAIFTRLLPSDDDLEDVQLIADLLAIRFDDMRRAAVTHPSLAVPTEDPTPLPPGPAILTRAELRTLERQMVESALARSHGKVFGPGGAAEILGMKPTTLASRIKALGIG